jgi:hypothetical protein
MTEISLVVGNREMLSAFGRCLAPVEYTVEVQYSCRMAAAGKDNIVNMPHILASDTGQNRVPVR